jgi:hypothetical protein
MKPYPREEGRRLAQLREKELPEEVLEFLRWNNLEFDSKDVYAFNKSKARRGCAWAAVQYLRSDTRFMRKYHTEHYWAWVDKYSTMERPST